jgi:hypothetical protein
VILAPAARGGGTISAMPRHGPPPPPSPDAAPRDFGPYDPHADDGPRDRTQQLRSRPHVPSKQHGARKVELSSVNRFGLASPSEAKYPQAYAPVDETFWEGLTDAQRSALDRIQAIAQEKVGFERGTPKFFIEDIDPHAPPGDDRGPNIQAIVHDPVSGGEIRTNRTARRPAAVVQAPPFLADIIVRLPVGGILLGAGLLAYIFAAAHLVRPELETPVLALGLAGLAAGIGLLWAKAA